MAILPAQEPDSHAQEKSGNGAPFSLVRFFWASKRNEQDNKGFLKNFNHTVLPQNNEPAPD
jgi:hypothetical protein